MILLPIEYLIASTSSFQQFPIQLFTATIFGLILYLPVHFKRLHFGMGDIKLLVVMALYLPYQVTIITFLCATVVHSLFAIVQHYRHCGNLKTSRPFVPSLLCGFLITLILLAFSSGFAVTML
jgi:prepilin signal peptidase PulO-like enzyme (type II secretory pathway)